MLAEEGSIRRSRFFLWASFSLLLTMTTIVDSRVSADTLPNEFTLQMSWYPRSYRDSMPYRPDEYNLTYPSLPSGPYHSLGSPNSGRLYTIGTVAIDGPLVFYAPREEVIKVLTLQNNPVYTDSYSSLYPSFYISDDIGLSWRKSLNPLPSPVLRWLSAAILFETGGRKRYGTSTNITTPTTMMMNNTNLTRPTCSLICIIGGYLNGNNNNSSAPLIPTDRVDCTNNEGESWFPGPSLPFAVTRASVTQIRYNSIVLIGGNRYNNEYSSSSPYTYVNGTCSESWNDTKIYINIWESRIKFIPSVDGSRNNGSQCVLDTDYGWVPWNQLSPASDRADMVISTVWKNTKDAIDAEELMRTIDTNQSFDILGSEQNIPVPKLLIGSGEISGKFSVPVFDLWVTTNYSLPTNTPESVVERNWTLINRQIPSSTSYEYQIAVIQEPVRLFTDLRDNDGNAFLPGRVQIDVLPDDVIFYMEMDHAFVSSDGGKTFSTVLHKRFPNMGLGTGGLQESIDRSLRRLSIIRDPLHNFEPVIIGWSLNGYLWRGDFIPCRDKCPLNHWASGCMNDPYDSVCQPCSSCRPGHYIALECMSNGLYMDTYCLPCSTCVDGETVIIPCSGKQNTVCGVPVSSSPKFSITGENYFTYSYIFTITLLVLIFGLGYGNQVWNAKKNNEGNITVTFYSVSRTLLVYWPCYSTVISFVNHITLLLVVSKNTNVFDIFLSFLIIFCIGICSNLLLLVYYVSIVSFFRNGNGNTPRIIDKIPSVFIGIVSLGHSRALLCHSALTGSVKSGTVPSANTIIMNSLQLTTETSTKGSTKSNVGTTPPTQKMYRHVLWIIITSTLIVDVPFLFPFFFFRLFDLPINFIIFLIISTVIDVMNIMFTMIRVWNRFYRLKLVNKLLMRQPMMELSSSSSVGDTEGNNIFLMDIDQLRDTNSIVTTIIRQPNILPEEKDTIHDDQSNDGGSSLSPSMDPSLNPPRRLLPESTVGISSQRLNNYPLSSSATNLSGTGTSLGPFIRRPPMSISSEPSTDYQQSVLFSASEALNHNPQPSGNNTGVVNPTVIPNDEASTWLRSMFTAGTVTTTGTINTNPGSSPALFINPQQPNLENRIHRCIILGSGLDLGTTSSVDGGGGGGGIVVGELPDDPRM